MIIADPQGLLPEGRRYWTSSPHQASPIYVTGEVARVFFGRSPEWLKKHLRLRDYPTPEEGDVTPRKGPNGYYEWRLYDIERMAHALAINRHIDGQRLELVIRMVRTNAQLHGVLS